LVLLIRCSDLVRSRYAGFSQKIRVAIVPRYLNSDGLEGFRIKGAIDYIPPERGTTNGTPTQIHMTFIASSMNVLWRGQHRAGSIVWIGVNSQFVHNQRMLHAICAILEKNHVLQILWAELV